MRKLKLTPAKVFREKKRTKHPAQSTRQMLAAMRQWRAAVSADDGGLSTMMEWADATFTPIKRALKSGEMDLDSVEWRNSVEWRARMVRVCALEAERAVKTGDAKTALREGLKAASHYWIGAIIEQRHGANIVTGRNVRNRLRVDGRHLKLRTRFEEIKRNWPDGRKFVAAKAHRILAEEFDMEESTVKKSLQRHD